MYRIQARVSNKATLPTYLGRKPVSHQFIGRKARISTRRRY